MFRMETFVSEIMSQIKKKKQNQWLICFKYYWFWNIAYKILWLFTFLYRFIRRIKIQIYLSIKQIFIIKIYFLALLLNIANIFLKHILVFSIFYISYHMFRKLFIIISMSTRNNNQSYFSYGYNFIKFLVWLYFPRPGFY